MHTYILPELGKDFTAYTRKPIKISKTQREGPVRNRKNHM